MQGKGLCRELLETTEQSIARAGGKRIFIETSHRADYASTWAFYQSCGYALASVLDDFYGPGDAKAAYCRTLGKYPPGRTASATGFLHCLLV